MVLSVEQYVMSMGKNEFSFSYASCAWGQSMTNDELSMFILWLDSSEKNYWQL